MHADYLIYTWHADKCMTTIYKMKPFSRKKFIYGSHPPFTAHCLFTGTTTVTSSVAASLKTWTKTHSAATEACSTLKITATCTSVTENVFHVTLYHTLLCLMDILHRLSDGRAACFNPLPVAAGDSAAAPHESEWDFQTISSVCFTLLAKPDGWSSTHQTNTRKFKPSLEGILKKNTAHSVIENTIRQNCNMAATFWHTCECCTDYLPVKDGRWKSASLIDQNELYLPLHIQADTYIHTVIHTRITDCRVKCKSWYIIS